jgi:PAS domain-containing protein
VPEIHCHRTPHAGPRSVAFFADIPDANALLCEVVEASPDCFKILDLFGRVEFMNRNGQCLLEISDIAAVEGRHLASLWPAEEQRKVEVAVAAARAGDTARFTGFCPTQGGAPKWWDVMVYCVQDGEGRAAKIAAVSRDITAAVQTQRDLEAMLAELKGLLDANALLKAAA